MKCIVGNVLTPLALHAWAGINQFKKGRGLEPMGIKEHGKITVLSR